MTQVQDGQLRISVIIPTLGRPSISKTLESIQHQISDQDEVLIISDGPQPLAEQASLEAGGSFKYFEGPTTRRWGHAQRQLGMTLARGDYLAFMDDDDIYLPGAFDAMRRAASENDAALFLFRMYHQGAVIWERPEIVFSNVSTQMILLKNEPSKFANWRPRDDPHGGGGDFLFIQDTAALWPSERIVFREEIIANVENHNQGL